jgi:hypothetical protein
MTTMPDKLLGQRIIWGAMLMGQSMFFVVTLVIPHGPAQPELARLLVPIAYGMLIVCAAIALSLPTLMNRRAVGTSVNPSAEQQVRIFQMALLEAPSLFSLVGYLITSASAILGAFAIAFLLLLSIFPRRRQS